MKFPYKKISFLFILTLAVFAALALTTPAFAEGEAPPTEPVAVEPANAPPVDDSPVEAEAVEALPAEPEAAAQPVVEAPSEAPVEVCEGEGSADPYFYDASHTKHGGYTTIQAAVDDFVTLKGTGFIYVEFGTYNAEPSDEIHVYDVEDLSGIVFTDYYASERDPGDTFNTLDPSTWPLINAGFNIQEQTSGFTLLGLRITQSLSSNSLVYFVNNTGTLNLSYLDIKNTGATAGKGLEIYTHTGAVNVNSVVCHNNSAEGAEIGNGADKTVIQGKVTVTNSTFNNNGQEGLTIISNSLATLSGVNASNNQIDGASVHTAGATVKNSVFNSNSLAGGSDSGFWYTSTYTGNLTFENVQFLGNHGFGLDAKVYGNISLKNVIASTNYGAGVNLDTCDYNGATCRNPGSGNVTINDSQFENNGASAAYDSNGLFISDAKGSITLTSVTASFNGDADTASGGAFISNIHSPSKSPVSITNSTFYANHSDGLTVDTLGAITIKDISAVLNTGASSGAQLNNANPGSTSGVTLLNTLGGGNVFNANEVSGAGLSIASNGAIVANWIFAYNNSGGSGVQLDNTGSTSSAPVTVNYGGFNNNAADGLDIATNGVVNILLTSCEIMNNGGVGIAVDNSSASAAKNVTIDGGTYFNNGDDAIAIDSLGAVTVQNVAVSQNSGNGVSVNNSGSPSKGGVTITTTRKGWINTFNENTGEGIDIFTKGAIVINNTDAIGNHLQAVNLFNSLSGATGAVTITNARFNKNCTAVNNNAVYVTTNGAIKLTNVQANDNGDVDSDAQGADLNNYYLSTPQAVTILNSQFNGNSDDGLLVTSNGIITLSNVEVCNNLGSGADLDNATTSKPQLVSVTASKFNGNHGDGLDIFSKGNVTVVDSHASNNEGGQGVSVKNDSGDGANVSISCKTEKCRFSNNDYEGVYIISKGNITLDKLEMIGNIEGMDISNVLAANNSAKNVTISNSIVLGSRTSFGLHINSKGTITLTSVSSNGNATYGATLDNSASDKKAGVMLTDVSFNDNTGNGLVVDTNGIINITNIDAMDNGGNGVDLDNRKDGSTGAVNIKRSGTLINRIKRNGGAGLLVYSNAAITLYGIHAYQNAGNYGIYVDNNSSFENIPAAVALTLCVSNDNGDTSGIAGIMINAEGAVNLTDVSAGGSRGTTGDGIKIDNRFLAGQNVNLTRVWTNGNKASGVTVYTYGQVTARDLSAYSNKSSGVVVQANSATGTCNVTLTGVNFFGHNGANGISITANGTIDLTGVTASSNATTGVYLDADPGAGTVTLNKIFADANLQRGLYVRTNNHITLNTITAQANGSSGNYDGAYLTTDNAAAAIKITNSAFHSNTDSGLEVVKTGDLGLVTLTNVTYSGNDSNGTGGVLDINIHH